MLVNQEKNTTQQSSVNTIEKANEGQERLSLTPPPFQLFSMAPPNDEKPFQLQTNNNAPIQLNDWSRGMDIIRDQGLGASLREIWDYITEDDLDDAQDVISNLDTALTRGSQALTAAEGLASDPTMVRRLGQVRGALDRMQRYTSRTLQAGEVYNNIRTFRNLVEAVEDMPENITDDPEGAASAMGRIISSLGTLGGLLPSGPWSGYFEFLSGFETFFTDMYRVVNTDAITEDRFRRQGLDPNNPGGTYTSTRELPRP